LEYSNILVPIRCDDLQTVTGPAENQADWIDTHVMSNLSESKALTSVSRFSLPVIRASLFLALSSQICMAQQAEATVTKDDNPRAMAGKTVAPTPVAVEARSNVSPTSADTGTALRLAKVIYVRSTSLLVGASVVEEKLQRRPEFQQLGLLLTRDEGQADLILELRHDLFTMYVFTAIDRNTKVVVASGKLSSLGGTVAGKVAERFLKQVLKARQGAGSK
jgi:hypothetical protein